MTLDALLRETYLREHPDEAAASLEQMSTGAAAKQLDGVAPEALTAPFELLTQGRVTAIFRRLSTTQQAGMLATASPRLALTVLSALEDEQRQTLLASLPPAIREDLERLQSFDPEAAGALMDRLSVTYRAGMTVDEAKALLRQSRSRRQRTPAEHPRAARRQGAGDRAAQGNGGAAGELPS